MRPTPDLRPLPHRAAGPRQGLRASTALAGRAGLALMLAVLAPSIAKANPQDGTVVAGSATIRPGGPGQLDIVQGSDKAIIDWRRFGIAPGEQTRFQQPSTGSITLNRVTGPERSEIHGRLSANGQVWLVNPNGILFGRGAQVDVGGLVATTHNIRNEDFLAGNYRFEGNPGSTATVENEGTVTVREAGLAAFVAPGVVNRGTISARLGEVTLASGRRFVVDLFGDQKINLAVDAKTDARPVGADGKPLESLVSNEGKIFADGGRVRMSAAAAKGLVDSVVNLSGHVQARTVEEKDGEIVLSGDTAAGGGAVIVSGAIDARGTAPGGTGGRVSVTGERVALTATARIDASGAAAGGEVLIGGDVLGGRADPATLAGYNVRPARKPVPPARTTVVEAGATIAADATDAGKGGKVVLWSEEQTRFGGRISARGGAKGGDGGLIETSSKLSLQVQGLADASSPLAKAGLWLLDPRNVTIAASGTSVGSGTFVPTSDNESVDVNSIVTALNGGSSVTITTDDANGGAVGNIFLTSAISANPSSDVTFSLKAAQDVYVTANIVGSGSHKLNVVLNSDTNGSGGGIVEIQSGVQITTNNGNFIVGGGANPETSPALGNTSTTRYGVNINTATISTGTGSISILGQGGTETGGSNHGIKLEGTTLRTTTGAITLNGTAGSGSGGANHGIHATNATRIESNSGTITLTGVGGTGGSNNEGVRIEQETQIFANGSAPIAITATTTDSSSVGFSAGNNNNTIGGYNATGDITFSVDGFSAGSVGTVQSTGTLTIQQSSTSVPMIVGGSLAASTLVLDSAMLGAIMEGFTSMILGRSDNTVDFDLGNASVRNPTVIKSGARILVNNAFSTGSSTARGSIRLEAATNISVNSGASLTTQGEAIVLNADRDGDGTGNVTVQNGSIRSNGGAIVIGGGSDPTTGKAQGWSGQGYGVRLAGATITSGGGAITVNGRGSATDSDAHGVSIGDDTTISADSGAIKITGTTAGTSGNMAGVVMDGESKSVTISSSAANQAAITITGNASTANASTTLGVAVRGETIITSSGTGGSIEIEGRAGTATATDNAGISVARGTSTVSPQIRSYYGPIVMTGVKGTASSDVGIRLSEASKIGRGSLTSSSADIKLIADTMNLAAAGTPELRSTGKLYIEPLSSSTSIGLAGGPGTLFLSNASLGTIASDFTGLTVGKATGYGAISVGGPLNASTNLTLRNPASGSGGITLNGAVSVGSNRLTLESAGSVAQSAAITANALELLGSGATFSLNAVNSVGTIAGNAGTINFRNGDSFIVGHAGSTDGLTVNGTAMTLTSDSGNITQTRVLTNVGDLTLTAGGSITLNGAGSSAANTIGTLGRVSRGGSFSLSDGTGGLIVNNVISAGTGDLSIRTVGNLTLASGASIGASGGSGIALAPTGNFINNAGSGALTVSGGSRWVVYSAEHAQTVTGGLSGGFVYNQTFSSLPPASAPAGNQFVIAGAAPTTTTTPRTETTSGTTNTETTTTNTQTTTPPVTPTLETPVSPPVTTPVSPPVTPTVETPVSPPVSPPVTPTVVTTVSPPETPPTTVSPPVTPPPVTPTTVTEITSNPTVQTVVQTVLQTVNSVATVTPTPATTPATTQPTTAATPAATGPTAPTVVTTGGAVVRAAEPKTFLAALETGGSRATAPAETASAATGGSNSQGTASTGTGTASQGTTGQNGTAQSTTGQGSASQQGTGQQADNSSGSQQQDQEQQTQGQQAQQTQSSSPQQSGNTPAAPPQAPPAPATVALAGGGTATFTAAATSAYQSGATLSQPSPQVLSSPVVQAAAGNIVQAATSGGSITQAVATVASSGLSLTEQKAVFQSVPAATLVTGLVNSPDPVAKQVGGLLQTTANSGRAAYAEVKTVLKQAGYDAATTKTYLAMYQRVRREQRTRSLDRALRQLVADPGLSDLFPSHTDDGTPAPNIVEFTPAGTRRTRAVVRGLIDSSVRVSEARVNGQWVFIDDQGRFRTDLAVAPGQTEAVLTIVDDTGVKSERKVAVQTPAAATAAPAQTDGRKIALMIAVDTYRNPEIPALGTPAADIAAVGQALNQRLGYETRVLRNPTKAQIADALRRLGREVTEQDQVMVYYAGHGYELAETGTGYWLPADADTDTPRNWLSNNDIGRFLNRMPAKQVLLVSDSCYSGAFTKEQKIDSATLARGGEELRQRRSVMALSSGGDEPVADGETNSPFAAALMARVRSLPRESGGFELYEQLREDVTREVPQTPQYGVIKAAGYDEGGDFLVAPARALVN